MRSNANFILPLGTRCVVLRASCENYYFEEIFLLFLSKTFPRVDDSIQVKSDRESLFCFLAQFGNFVVDFFEFTLLYGTLAKQKNKL